MYQYPYGNAQQLNLDWILSKLQELESGSGGGADLEEVANALVSASFDVTIPYRKYDYAFYDGKLYRALNDNIGAFNPADWMEVTLGADIPVLTRLVNADSALLTTLQNKVDNLGSDDVANESTVTGTTVSDALGNLNGAMDNKAPKSHASTATTYGKGTSTKYGHVKISDSLTDTTPAATGGIVPSMKAVSNLNDAITSLQSKTTNLEKYDINESGTYSIGRIMLSGVTTGSGNYADFYLPLRINPSLTLAYSYDPPNGNAGSSVWIVGGSETRAINGVVTEISKGSLGIMIEINFTTTQVINTPCIVRMFNFKIVAS